MQLEQQISEDFPIETVELAVSDRLTLAGFFVDGDWTWGWCLDDEPLTWWPDLYRSWPGLGEAN